MKSLTVFESSIIGFFVGALVATYILCIDATGGYVGHVLGIISLRPVLELFTVPKDLALAVDFSFYVLVYILYGAIIGFLAKKSLKIMLVVIPLVIILAVAVFLEQKNSPPAAYLTADSYAAIQIAPKQTTKIASQQYFGTEAIGDLNNDGKDDVAFILSRTDPDRGSLYYLAAALATDAGHQGTNLVFLGNGVVPQDISITNGIITIPYTALVNKTATTTKYFYAQMANGALEQIQVDPKDSLVFGEIGQEGNIQTFKRCGGTDVYMLVATSTMYQMIQNELEATASSSGNAHTSGIFIGKTRALSNQTSASSTYATSFLLDKIINLVPNDICR